MTEDEFRFMMIRLLQKILIELKIFNLDEGPEDGGVNVEALEAALKALDKAFDRPPVIEPDPEEEEDDPEDHVIIPFKRRTRREGWVI